MDVPGTVLDKQGHTWDSTTPRSSFADFGQPWSNLGHSALKLVYSRDMLGAGTQENHCSLESLFS